MGNNIEIKALTERVLKQLNDFYDGNSWVTDNMKKKVFSLESSVAFKKVAGHSHSAAQQVAHIIAWRNFVIQMLAGNESFRIEDNSLSDWPEPGDWIGLIKEFETHHEYLIAAIKNFPVEQWNSKVPGRNYSFIYLINGIVEHDYYHYGQIGAVLAAIRKMEE